MKFHWLNGLLPRHRNLVVGLCQLKVIKTIHFIPIKYLKRDGLNIFTNGIRWAVTGRIIIWAAERFLSGLVIRSPGR